MAENQNQDQDINDEELTDIAGGGGYRGGAAQSVRPEYRGGAIQGVEPDYRGGGGQ